MNLVDVLPAKQSFTESEGHPPMWIQWFSQLALLFNDSQATGATAQRPLRAPFIGFPYFDTTLNRPIWAKTVTPATWVFADGTNA